MITEQSKLDIKIGFISFLIVACALFLASCDTFETDPDLRVPEVKFECGELVVISNGSTYIDLGAKVKSNVRVNFSITSPVQKGSLTDLRGGLLQYKPSAGLETGRDSFVFSVFSESNQLITKDTVVIVIENDSTQLPCGIYTGVDYVYGFTGESSVVVDVLANDIICSIDSLDVRVSIHRAFNNLSPYIGTSSVVDNKIVYTANTSFQTQDTVVYKIESAIDASMVSYGLVYITHESSCFPIADNDLFAIDSLDRIGESYFLPTFYNDQVCVAASNSDISITSQPRFGVVSIVTGGFLYTAADSLQIDGNFADSFIYKVCEGNRCASAQVTLSALRNSDQSCFIKAIADSIDLSANTLSPVSIDVLFNDVICDSLKTFKITIFPTNGAASIQGSVIMYERDLSKPVDDRLEYEICNELECSSAIVFIKRE